ncbi:MAG: ferrous iron transport protein A [Alphaproteobacteria bacterium]|nr:ferrous iron transport protein A [Alphaproteobacteria bacterium]
MTLDGLEYDRPARIVAVSWDRLASDEAKRLRALGVDEGAELAVIHRGVFGTRDPLALRLGNMTIALRRSHALAIEVELLDGAAGEVAA